MRRKAGLASRPATETRSWPFAVGSVSSTSASPPLTRSARLLRTRISMWRAGLCADAGAAPTSTAQATNAPGHRLLRTPPPTTPDIMSEQPVRVKPLGAAERGAPLLLERPYALGVVGR